MEEEDSNIDTEENKDYMIKDTGYSAYMDSNIDYSEENINLSKGKPRQSNPSKNSNELNLEENMDSNIHYSEENINLINRKPRQSNLPQNSNELNLEEIMDSNIDYSEENIDSINRKPQQSKLRDYSNKFNLEELMLLKENKQSDKLLKRKKDEELFVSLTNSLKGKKKKKMTKKKKKMKKKKMKKKKMKKKKMKKICKKTKKQTYFSLYLGV